MHLFSQKAIKTS